MIGEVHINPLSSESKKNNPLKRKKFEESLDNIFSFPPSNLGYKVDIEFLLEDLEISKDEFLEMTISSLSKTIKKDEDIKVISSYLFFMPGFMKLITKGREQKEIKKEEEQNLLKTLFYLAETLTLMKCQSKTVLMRLGEIGFSRRRS